MLLALVATYRIERVNEAYLLYKDEVCGQP